VALQWPEVLDRCRDPERDAFLDTPHATPTIRANCDAIEIAAAFGRLDAVGSAERWIAELRNLQDGATGLFPEPTEGQPSDPLACRPGREFHQYGVLSVGYALEVLGSAPAHPVRIVGDLGEAELVRRLDALPWRELAWPAGSWIDFVATATYLDRRHHGATRGLETLFGWLQTRHDRRSGMWGAPNDAWGWLMPVNAFYRLTRGTYAQFGVPLPCPEASIDTVVAHCRDNGWFAERRRDACNVLDVVHPIWLCSRQTDYRRPELRDRLSALLDRTLDHWIDGKGFAFGTRDDPGLQGTEMWLSIVYLLADYLDESEGLSWRPRGVHRLPPADVLAVDLAV
jgi:hypothetical protein